MMGQRDDRNGIYYIRVRGHLSQRWSDWFDGFQVSYCGGDTVLTGSVVDQAALHGALAKIRDLGLPILLVENLKSEGDDHGPS
jgi:hypothetical protein